MWIWSKLSGAKWEDAWEDRFYGNPNVVISMLKSNKTVRVEVYTETETEASAIQEQFGGSIRKLVNKNWAEMTQSNHPPIKIRSSLVIIGEREENARAKFAKEFPGRHIIQVPADMAFGTGDHATTSTCMRFLVDISKERKNSSWEMLDLGTGTGVIAIAARMLGADKCLGIDFDHQAVVVAQRNVTRNEVDEVTMTDGDVLKWTPERQWPVIVANMFSTILQKGFPTIAASLATGGDIIVSGILKEQWEETRDIAELSHLTFSEVITKGKWVSARGTKTKG